MRPAVPLAAVAALTSIAFATSAGAHELDHAAPAFVLPASPPSSNVLAGGPEAKWELVRTIATGNPHSDIDFFTKDGETYLSAGTLGVGPNAGGQTLVQLTADDGREVSPRYVGAHPSAACASATTSATALQHDVEATPKGDVILNEANPRAVKRDAELLIDATDGSGRCHDNGTLGATGAPSGGLEIIDITNPAQPKEIGLIRATGNAHTVNVDPKRPHIAFIVTQDGVAVGPNGERANDTSGNALDGFEVVDLSSCMGFPAGTTIEQKRAACRPQVFRYRYPKAAVSKSHRYGSMQSCHEVEIYADDRLTCASITATVLFDLKGAFRPDGKPRGEALPCNVVASSSLASGTKASVTDCATGLNVSSWRAKGAPSIVGVTWLGTVPHMGFQNGDNSTIVRTPFPATRDLVAAHESEFSGSKKFVITSDERGGGVLPPGSSCAPGPDLDQTNGGLHFFPLRSFDRSPPTTAAEAHKLWAKQPDGKPAIWRAPIRTAPEANTCTSHVFQQIPGQNRIFMGYYSQGTQVLDFTENRDGTISFRNAGFFIPENANTWTSAIFKMQRNANGTWTYWGATSDGILPGTGRSAIDVFKVTLPAPPVPRTR